MRREETLDLNSINAAKLKPRTRYAIVHTAYGRNPAEISEAYNATHADAMTGRQVSTLIKRYAALIDAMRALRPALDEVAALPALRRAEVDVLDKVARGVASVKTPKPIDLLNLVKVLRELRTLNTQIARDCEESVPPPESKAAGVLAKHAAKKSPSTHSQESTQDEA